VLPRRRGGAVAPPRMRGPQVYGRAGRLSSGWRGPGGTACYTSGRSEVGPPLADGRLRAGRNLGGEPVGFRRDPIRGSVRGNEMRG
jgi:hypothetical protein